VDSVAVDHHLRGSVSVVVVDIRNRTVDGNLLKVGSTMTAQLSIKVREDAALKQGVLAKVDSANNVTGLELFSQQMSALEF